MTINKYVGSRYVPIYIGIHDETIEYEPLSIVSNTEKTETYTSKQHVPKGVSLDNETYWVQSGFSNADLQIDVDSAGYLSTDSSDLEIEKTKSGYLITLNASNSFDCGGEFGEAYTLNTLYDVGRYVINPSLCTGIPSELENISNPAELVISEYTKKDEEIFYQYQKITAYDSDNAASFIRFHDGKNWSDWKMIGGNGGGSYTLPIASDSTLGGVKIGSGVNISSDGTISVSGGGGSASGEWKSVTPTLKAGYNTNGEIINFYHNEAAKMFRATVKGTIKSSVFSNSANNGKQINQDSDTLRLPIDLDDLQTKINASGRISPIDVLGNNHITANTIYSGNYDAAIVDIVYSASYSAGVINIVDIVAKSAIIFANSDSHIDKNFITQIYIPYEIIQ